MFCDGALAASLLLHRQCRFAQHWLELLLFCKQKGTVWLVRCSWHLYFFNFITGQASCFGNYTFIHPLIFHYFCYLQLFFFLSI